MTSLRGQLLIDGAFVPGALRIAGERIAEVLPDEPRAGGTQDDETSQRLLAPGAIDLHVHGYGGADPTKDLEGAARALARVGTTSFLPTLFPDAPEALGATAAAAWEAAGRLAPDVARVKGLHLEGPFVSPNKAGALVPSLLAEPSVDALRAILGPATGDGRGVRTMTLAPELPGAADLIAELVRSGVRVSLGHSEARAADARAAARAGAVGATHLFNAMAPLHHREAGLLGFALSQDALVAEIIGDLVHVGPDAFALALAARGPRGLALVSDALSGAGTGCDVFHEHGREHRVEDAVWIPDPNAPDGRRLAGAAAPQLEAVRRLVRAGVATAAEALTMATETPARALGIEHELGRLRPGSLADVIVLRADYLILEEVWIGGRRVV